MYISYAIHNVIKTQEYRVDSNQLKIYLRFRSIELILKIKEYRVNT